MDCWKQVAEIDESRNHAALRACVVYDDSKHEEAIRVLSKSLHAHKDSGDPKRISHILEALLDHAITCWNMHKTTIGDKENMCCCCALCHKESAVLINSHIIPRSVLERVQRGSGVPTISISSQPNRKLKARTVTVPLLCEQCDSVLLGKWERAFADEYDSLCMPKNTSRNEPSLVQKVSASHTWQNDHRLFFASLFIRALMRPLQHPCHSHQLTINVREAEYSPRFEFLRETRRQLLSDNPESVKLDMYGLMLPPTLPEALEEASIAALKSFHWGFTNWFPEDQFPSTVIVVRFRLWILVAFLPGSPITKPTTWLELWNPPPLRIPNATERIHMVTQTDDSFTQAVIAGLVNDSRRIKAYRTMDRGADSVEADRKRVNPLNRLARALSERVQLMTMANKNSSKDVRLLCSNHGFKAQNDEASSLTLPDGWTICRKMAISELEGNHGCWFAVLLRSPEFHIQEGELYALVISATMPELQPVSLSLVPFKSCLRTGTVELKLNVTGNMQFEDHSIVVVKTLIRSVLDRIDSNTQWHGGLVLCNLEQVPLSPVILNLQHRTARSFLGHQATRPTTECAEFSECLERIMNDINIVLEEERCLTTAEDELTIGAQNLTGCED